MNREREDDELIDLGAATSKTKGPTAGMDDSQGGLRLWAGLSDE